MKKGWHVTQKRRAEGKANMPSKLNRKTCAFWQAWLLPAAEMLLDSSVKGAFYVTQKNVVDVLILLVFIELIQQQNQERFNSLPQRGSREFSLQRAFSIPTMNFPLKNFP